METLSKHKNKVLLPKGYFFNAFAKVLHAAGPLNCGTVEMRIGTPHGGLIQHKQLQSTKSNRS